MLKTTCTALGLAACLAPAHALTLDFGAGPAAPVLCALTSTGDGLPQTCGNGGYVSQTYGDVPGVLDVVYNAPRVSTSATLRWWASDYNGLFGVVWADGGDTNSQAVIDLLPLNGNGVGLTGFDLGAYPDTSRGTSVSVIDLGSNAVLFSFTGPVGIQPGNQATHFALNNVSSTVGLRIQWQDSAYNVGIDNIDVSVGVVPEPAHWALLAGGLLALAILTRRRQPR